MIITVFVVAFPAKSSAVTDIKFWPTCRGMLDTDHLADFQYPLSLAVPEAPDPLRQVTLYRPTLSLAEPFSWTVPDDETLAWPSILKTGAILSKFQRTRCASSI